MDIMESSWRTVVGIPVQYRREQLGLSKRAAAHIAGTSTPRLIEIPDLAIKLRVPEEQIVLAVYRSEVKRRIKR